MRDESTPDFDMPELLFWPGDRYMDRPRPGGDALSAPPPDLAFSGGARSGSGGVSAPRSSGFIRGGQLQSVLDGSSGGGGGGGGGQSGGGGHGGGSAGANGAASHHQAAPPGPPPDGGEDKARPWLSSPPQVGTVP